MLNISWALDLTQTNMFRNLEKYLFLNFMLDFKKIRAIREEKNLVRSNRPKIKLLARRNTVESKSF